MRAVGAATRGELDDIELPDPVPEGRDLLVEVRAVSVNPVDAKVRARQTPAPGEWLVLGYDAAGVVAAVGDACTSFGVGDEVWYAGWPGRAGSNSELQLVDERVVGRKPASLDFPAAAAMPLTTLTAWEMLFDRLGVDQPDAGRAEDASASTLLVVGGAGGVGSMAVQLARQLTGRTVVATASRPETRDWVLELGAHHVLDHSRPLAAQVAALDLPPVDVVFSTTRTDEHWGDLVELLAPQGRIGLIDDPELVDIRLLKQKSGSVHWEYMPTRPVFGTTDMRRQHEILDEVADLVDAEVLRSTMTDVLGVIDAATLERAHSAIRSGGTRGKLVLAGWP